MIWGVVVAAGSGSRFGGLKQYAELGGRRVLDLACESARDFCDGVVLVVPGALGFDEPSQPGVVVVAGGPTRSESVRRGLAAAPESAGIIVVHDAVRPLASSSLWAAVIQAVRAGADAAIPAMAVIDTIKMVHSDGSLETLNRDNLVAVQTPQAFRAAALRAAHATATEATDDAALVELQGGRVVIVAGAAGNIKITNPHDLAVAETLVRLGERQR